MISPRRPLAAAALAALAAAAAAGASASAPHPSAGDWEGSANGHPISFQVVRQGSRVTIRNSVAEVPRGCRGGRRSYGLVAAGALGRLDASGRFGSGALTGVFSSPRKATASYRSGKCAAHWSLRPGRRRPIAPGPWRSDAAEQFPLSFSVDAGGRDLVGVNGQVSASCAGSTETASFSDPYVFVKPSGAFAADFTPVAPLRVRLAGRFDSASSAHGTLTVDGLCTRVSATWGASRG